MRKIVKLIHHLAGLAAESVLADVKRDAPWQLRDKRRDRLQFEERLSQHWQLPLNLLDMLTSLSVEAGSNFNRAFRQGAVKSDDAAFEALTRLHARACQVSSAVLVLLRSGYADDAHARWRTLHEIAVIGAFLRENDQEVATRYLLHDTVQRYKLAVRHRKYANQLNEEPIEQEEFDKLTVQYEALLSRFGKQFSRDYGWAASVIDSGQVSFGAIEERSGLEHIRPRYRMASDNVHANSHGVYYRLGLNLSSDQEVLLAGPSNTGLADPGIATATSLCQITTTLLATRPSLENIITLQVLLRLREEIGEAFLQAQIKLEDLAEPT